MKDDLFSLYEYNEWANARVTGKSGQREQTTDKRNKAWQGDHADTLCTFGLWRVKGSLAEFTC